MHLAARPPRWPGPLAGTLTLSLYALTLAPGLTWAHSGADGGDLLAAALTRGVPHPSGYPTYLLLLTAVTALFPGEPARAGNWLSAACAAMAVALLTDLAGRMLVRLSAARQVAASRRAGIVALAAGLAWAASPTLWGQAVITEVYTLNALAVSALLWLLWRWREAVDAGQSGRPWLILGGLTLGLGLGNHLTLLLLTPAAGIWLWAGRGQMKDSRPLGVRAGVDRAAGWVGDLRLSATGRLGDAAGELGGPAHADGIVGACFRSALPRTDVRSANRAASPAG